MMQVKFFETLRFALSLVFADFAMLLAIVAARTLRSLLTLTLSIATVLEVLVGSIALLEEDFETATTV